MSAQIPVFDDDTSITSNDRDDAITDFAAGNLSPEKHALMSCVVELNPKAARKASFEANIAATLMTDIRPVPLSPLFIGETLAKLPMRGKPIRFAANDEPRQRIAPKSLRDLMGGKGLSDLKWKSVIPGIAIHDVLGDRHTRDGDRLYLFRAKGGMHMPQHSHDGEEWTLILSGSYAANGRHFKRGDLHIEDETTEHSPQIAEGEDCICLVMTQGPLKMKTLLPKIVQKVVGI